MAYVEVRSYDVVGVVVGFMDDGVYRFVNMGGKDKHKKTMHHHTKACWLTCGYWY